MTQHELWDPTTEVHNAYEEEKYRNHERPTVITSPLSEERLIRMEVLSLEDRESSHDDYEDESEETRFWYTEDHIRTITDHSICFRESFLEHIKCGEENDEESDPLNWWESLKHLSNPARCDDHEDDRNDESDHEVHDISMTGSGNSEDIVQWHRDISDDDRPDRSREGARASISLLMMLTRSDFSVKFPYHIEEEDGSEELESWDLEEKYDSEREDDTEDGGTSNSPEDGFLSYLGRELLRRHTDEDSVISTHDEVDEDDIEERESACCREKVSEVGLELWNEFEHREGIEIGDRNRGTSRSYSRKIRSSIMVRVISSPSSRYSMMSVRSSMGVMRVNCPGFSGWDFLHSTESYDMRDIIWS